MTDDSAARFGFASDREYLPSGHENDVFTTRMTNLDDAGGIVLGFEVRVE